MMTFKHWIVTWVIAFVLLAVGVPSLIVGAVSFVAWDLSTFDVSTWKEGGRAVLAWWWAVSSLIAFVIAKP